MMAHFDHPRELTTDAIDGLACFMKNGVVCVNQCPIIRGINDDPQVLAEMFRKLSYAGCPQYYLFQCRPTEGNDPYELPITESWHIFQEALQFGSGLARRARFVMSHETGKVEILAMDKQHIYARYHRAKHADLRGQFMIYKQDDSAKWLDDLELVSATPA
jgi:L-lysine 2,3-aminomutase